MTFPVVSADSDHRLLSIEPFGLRLGQSTILLPSQSLALGLTLTAAPQLVEGSRLKSSGRDQIETTVPAPRCPTPPGRLLLPLMCVKYVNSFA